MTDKDLSAQEFAFLDYLFDGEKMRNPDEAKQLAGYPSNYPVLKIIRKVSKELLQKCDDYLALYAPHGLMGLMDILNNPNEPGSKIRLQAVVELLDRAGVVKKEKSEVASAAPSYILYLPPKQELKE